MPQVDSPWKEALDEFLRPFLAMFADRVERRIDWTDLPESLDNELAKLAADGVIGTRFVDRLFKVRLLEGIEMWVLIHIEVQAQRDDDFPERLFRYFYRLRDKFNLPLMCLVVLADENRTWRPSEYVYQFEGTELHFTYPIVKLADYRERIEELESSENLFALIVLAHLQGQGEKDSTNRLEWKQRIAQNLLRRELENSRLWQVLRLVDWLIDLPIELNELYWTQIKEWKERDVMPYLTSLERSAQEKGLEAGFEQGLREGLMKGLELALESKFGLDGKVYFSEMKATADLTKLQRIRDTFPVANSIDELKRLV